MKWLAVSLSLILCTICSQAQNDNISSGFIFDGEPYLAVNPSNSQHMVVAWMGFVLGNYISIRTRVTTDGGSTWNNIVNIPHAVAGYGSADPSIGFDGNGNVYLTYVDYKAATLTGAVYCVKSSDGGLTWAPEVEVVNANADGAQYPVDRPWIAVDRSGGSNDGNIYVTTMNPNIFGPVPPPYNPYFIRSTDGGATFDP
ncbi:MAG: exo-alpha-sialidase [Flavobacteriales bacterium]|nr:exo-alpha-sialidase [Flavobacteriales bacterium]